MHGTVLRQWWWAPLLVVTGTAASFGVYFYVAQLQQQIAQSTFTGHAQSKVALLRQTLERGLDTASSVANLIRAQPGIDRQSFEEFGVLTLERDGYFSSLAWSAWVPAEARQAYVEQLQRDGYDVADLTTRPEPAAPLETMPPIEGHHLVMTRMAPAALAGVIGFDIASTRHYGPVVLRARDTGEPAMSAALPLGGRPADELGVVLFVPVYRTPAPPPTVDARREAFIGTASMGLLIEPMIRHVLDQQTPFVRTLVIDSTDTGEVVLFDRLAPGAARHSTDVATLAAHPLAVWETVEFGGRHWRVLCVPTNAFTAVHRSGRVPQLVLGLGLLTTVLATVAVGTMVRHNRLLGRHLDERDAAALDLARANESLQTANREMEEFVSSVSHDLKNPLVAIEWMTASLEAALNKGDTDRAREANGNIRQSARAIKRIIEDLLAHSRAGWAPMQNQPVDLAAVTHRLLDEHAGAIAKCNARVDVGELPTTIADPGRITAALDNLIANAIKYGCNGQQPPAITIATEQRGRELHLYVSDNGPGIPPDQRQRVFKLFHRLSTDGDGTGIGLAIVDRVARAHHGRTWVETSDTGGARFVIALPHTPP
jgi:signal transduction histidine kinase